MRLGLVFVDCLIRNDPQLACSPLRDSVVIEKYQRVQIALGAMLKPCGPQNLHVEFADTKFRRPA